MKKIRKRIIYCKKLLTNHRDAFIYYTLADLYDKDINEVEFLYKREVRFYCIMAIRKDRNYAPAWALLAEAYWGLTIIEDADETSDMLFEDEDGFPPSAKKERL